MRPVHRLPGKDGAGLKKNNVTLSVLPRAWWLVVAADIGRAVQVCVRLADEDGRAVLACVCPADEDSEFWSATGPPPRQSCRRHGGTLLVAKILDGGIGRRPGGAGVRASGKWGWRVLRLAAPGTVPCKALFLAFLIHFCPESAARSC